MRVAPANLVPVIVTFTPNPSLDRTALLAEPLTAQAVNHVVASCTVAGGRGVHLSATLHRAGWPTLAILPAQRDDPIVPVLRDSGIPYLLVPVARRLRSNMTVTYDGASTLIREPGATLAPETVTAMLSAVMGATPGASWLALSGSLPPGAPLDLYPRMIRMARGVGVRVALQTGGLALARVLDPRVGTPPDLLTLNARQFAEATGIELCHDDGYARVVAAAEHVGSLLSLGVPNVLVTLGVHGAVGASADGVWYARAQQAPVITAIGHGAAATAGWLMSHEAGAAVPERLGRALAYATARGIRAGSQPPSPADADAITVVVSQMLPAPQATPTVAAARPVRRGRTRRPTKAVTSAEPAAL